MDISRELISMRRRALEHQIKENVPVLRMPIINEGDQLPPPSPWVLPIVIEKPRVEFNGSEEK